ncbi:MAG TPA: metallophosphoesterase [bacterium]
MRRPLRLAHASDIHLDTDFYNGGDNVEQRDYYRGVFQTLLDRIVAEKPHLFLLPGDLFDSNRASDDTITWSMQALGKLPFPVIMIPGNHDCVEPNAIFHRHDFNQVENVRMLASPDGEATELPELQVIAWGKGMVEHSPEYSPLGDLKPAQPGVWNIALGHGIYVGKEGGYSHRSSPVEARQIEASGYDYIALGHHHALLNVSAKSTTAYYCGAPVPVSKGSQGTFLIVDLEDGKPANVTVHRL